MGGLFWVAGRIPMATGTALSHEATLTRRPFTSLPNQFSSLLTIVRKVANENFPNPDLNQVSDFLLVRFDSLLAQTICGMSFSLSLAFEIM